MGFRAFSGWLVRSVLGLVIFSLMFSLFVRFDSNQMAGQLFLDLYNHASEDSKAQLDQEIQKRCEGSAEEACKQDSAQGRYNGIIQLALAQKQLPQLNLGKWTLPLAGAALLLLIILFFIEMNHQLFQWHLGKLSIELGVGWMLAFFLGVLFSTVFAPDTSALLNAVVSGDLSSDTIRMAVMNVLPFAVARVFSVAFLYAGFSFVVMGSLLLVVAKRHIPKEDKSQPA